MIGYSADEIIEHLRKDYVRMTGRELSFSREDRDILTRMVQRTALEIVAKAVELNNRRLAEQLKLGG